MSDEKRRPMPPKSPPLPWNRRDAMCWDRGPRIGGDGAMRCVLPKGHHGLHEGDSSWRQHGWSS